MKMCSTTYLADELTWACRGSVRNCNVDYKDLCTRWGEAIGDRRYKPMFLAAMGSYVRIKFAGHVLDFRYNEETDSWIPDN